MHHEVVAGQHIIGRQVVEAELDGDDLVEAVEALPLALVRAPLLAARNGARRWTVCEGPVVRGHQRWKEGRTTSNKEK